MHGYLSVIKSQDEDRTPHPQILGGTHNGIQGGALLGRLVQGIQGGCSGRTAVPHYIQYGSGHGHLPLGKFGGQGGRGSRGVQDVGANMAALFYEDGGILAAPSRM